MKLIRAVIKGYKCIKNVEINFGGVHDKKSGFSAHLLVGLNGSGKSCFLEALCFIFTRVMQDEEPGFYFEITYETSEGTTVFVKSVNNKEDWTSAPLYVEINGEYSDRIPEYCKPRRIAAYCSGVNNIMESILLHSPKESLAGDLIDAVSGVNKDDILQDEINNILNYYERLDTDPRIFFLDSKLSHMVIPILFAVIPGYQNIHNAEEYILKRSELIKCTGKAVVPAAFSITINNNRLEECLNQYSRSPHYRRLQKILEWNETGKEDAIGDWVFHRIDNGLEAEEETVCSFFYTQGEEYPGYFHSGLSREFDGDPMSLLSVFLTAARSGVLTKIQFSFKLEGCDELMGLKAMSDGELMWMARMGLVLMSRSFGAADTLFLFDEPDIHFNDEWNLHFMSMLRSLSLSRKESPLHEYIIATHSTLLMTDAFPEQIHLFHYQSNEKGTTVQSPSISAFAAQREEISDKLFGAKSIGDFAGEVVDKALTESRTLEEILDLINKTGPGYSRFQLYERYYEIINEQKEGK